MRRHTGPTKGQMTALIVTNGIMATCAVVTLVTAARAAVQVTERVRDTTEDAKDFIRGARQAL